MLFLMVNFHYVHEENKYPYPGTHPVPAIRLKKQLELLSEDFTFIGQNTLHKALNGETRLPDRCCMITFDDGLRCQYENALPILDSMKIPAMFYAGGLPYAEGKAFFIHKFQYLRANLEPELLSNQIKLKYFELTGKEFKIDEEDKIRARNQYKYDKGKTLYFKFFVNHILEEQEKDFLIQNIFSDLVSDEKEFCETFYMSHEQLKDLSKRSYLGIHSYAHNHLCRLSQGESEKDICKNIETLKGITKEPLFSISYPYGTPESVSLEVANTAKKQGCLWGVTIEKAFNRSLTNPLLFARLDTNDTIGGEKPLFNFEDGNLKILSGVQKRRTIYFEESVVDDI